MTGPAMTTDEAKAAVSKKTKPRVTEEAITAAIKNVEYLTHGLSTICIIEMYNGFKFFGHSTPAHAGNYDVAVGQRYAYDNCFKQIWQFEGYMLREQLYQSEQQG